MIKHFEHFLGLVYLAATATSAGALWLELVGDWLKIIVGIIGIFSGIAAYRYYRDARIDNRMVAKERAEKYRQQGMDAAAVRRAMSRKPGETYVPTAKEEGDTTK